MKKGQFYEHVNQGTTLMMEVLDILHSSHKVVMLSVTWWSKTGSYYGHAHGMPRKLTLDNKARANWKERGGGLRRQVS